ncbi:hypothetical protein [Amycolatopsis sp. NPDC004625]|uniref:hypothetical protein n=1 Tax=Amycolatopsis sp. NPDC004625 TaxID=3154670 RepID=UPI00339DF1C6
MINEKGLYLSAMDDRSSVDRGSTAPDADRLGLLALLNGAVGGAILLAVVFWVVVVLLPEGKPASVSIGVWVILAALAVLSLTGFVLVRLSRRHPERESIALPGAMSLFGFCLLLGFLIGGTNTGLVVIDPITKFAIVVGGTALASFVFGLLLFDTIRAAASVPIVVLFICTATFPAPLPELAAIRPTLITWMGVILGAAALTEGANQIAGTIRSTRVAQAVVEKAGENSLASDQDLPSVVRQGFRTEPGDLRGNREELR